MDFENNYGMENNRLSSIYKIILEFLKDPEELFLVQSIEEQKIFICNRNGFLESFDISTSRFGNGIRENSFKTPPGIHRIAEKIGADVPSGRIFKERKDTKVDWDKKSIEENLILTRILRLEGLEEGINKGEGVDSYERCIYIHGTNLEKEVGNPLSHGCLALRNQDIIKLFDIVSEETILYIDPPPIMVNNKQCRKIHFTGIFGTGMSAIAQYLRFQGIAVSGSDRLLTSEDTLSIGKHLKELGCTLVIQDGSGIDSDTDAVCISTAIEKSNPDIAAARSRNIPVIHRSDLLASIIRLKRTIAVAGTSGKSTVTAMIFEFLTACGRSPSLISGAPLLRLEKKGMIGNAWSGGSDLLIVEADESDGTIVKYSPEIAVILNISKDHKTVEEVKDLFKNLVSNSCLSVLNSDDQYLASLPASIKFGINSSASWRPDRTELLPDSVKAIRNNIEYHLPFPGRHNLENLMAALCICYHLSCEEKILADAVKNFKGVARRFNVTKTLKDIYVVDDFAHNPAKIAAAVISSRGLSKRVIAIYQPHGFGPTRFLKDEYISTFKKIFLKNDFLYLLPIYYAGGTAKKNISSEDIINGLGTVPFNCEAIAGRNELLSKLAVKADSGDCVLVMGARDPSLPNLVGKIIELFGGKNKFEVSDKS